MKFFKLDEFFSILGRIHVARETCLKLPQNPQPLQTWSVFSSVCESVNVFFHEAGFHHVALKAFALKAEMETIPFHFDPSAVRASFKGLEDDISIEMMKHRFVQVDASAARFLKLRDLFGEKVCESFPNAIPDIDDAGNCLAVGLGTSSVFHLMRVVEWGLRSFAHNLGLSKVVADRKRGKTIPLEFSQWEKILSQIPEQIEKRLLKLKPGAKKQIEQEFYYSTHKEVGAFKDAWRNHVMHVRRHYTPEEAQGIFSHVELFMKSLAAFGIRER